MFPGNSDGDGAGITLWKPSMHILMAKVNSPCKAASPSPQCLPLSCMVVIRGAVDWALTRNARFRLLLTLTWPFSSLPQCKGASLVAQNVTNLPAMQETRVPSLGQEDPLEKGMAVHSSICLENSMDRGAWQAAVHGVSKSGT